MKKKINFQNIFIAISAIFLVGCCCFYGYRLVKYYKVFNPKTEGGEKTEVLSVRVRKDNPVISEGEGLYNHNGDFIFKGEKVNNYVSFGDNIWRIVRISKGGSIKLILDSNLEKSQWATEVKDYPNSLIYTYLQDEKNLKLNQNLMDKMVVCLDKIDDANKIACEETLKDQSVALLTIGDYINSMDKKSFISSEEGFFLGHVSSDGMAWIVEDGVVTAEEMSETYGIRPVITLKSTVYSKTGDGTKEKPYIIEEA